MLIYTSLLTYLILIQYFILNRYPAVYANHTTTLASAPRTFTIDAERGTFLMNGEPFRYISGTFHYFRALPETWEEKLKTMRAAGLNAVDTYVEWSLHNPKDNIYDFEGIADLELFLKLAENVGFYVILRPGPYICAERDNGGLPFWLFNKYPNIKVRTSDKNYLNEVGKWYSVLMPKMQKYFYENGGPIIMIQIENEYGAFPACDRAYLNWLRDETELYVQRKAILFTTDIPDEKMSCGKIDHVFATVDFGIDKIHEMDKIWEKLVALQGKIPLVNSEFYSGWLTHWQEDNQRRDANKVAAALRRILDDGASVNLYMFFGGTNFGFTAGANDWGIGNYTPDITSYDYDAVMNEAGDPTEKYFKLKDIIKLFTELPKIPIPKNKSKMNLNPDVELKPIGNLLDEDVKEILGVKTVISLKPKTFEELNQFSGLVLYESNLPNINVDPFLLTVNKLHDRGLIYVDHNFVGILSRQNAIYSLPVMSSYGRKLKILVENQGRINFHTANDMKGILGDVIIENLPIHNWTSISMPLEYIQLKKLIEKKKTNGNSSLIGSQGGLLLNGPIVLHALFKIEADNIFDTYLDTSEFGKGVVYINGFNLGRYWCVGPQRTLYVPKELLKKEFNEIVIIEYQKTPVHKKFKFISYPKLD